MQPQEQLDPSIMALTKAIGHQESGGKYDLVGDNGHSVGAYQWNNPIPLKKGEVPKNFRSYASEIGANPDDFSPENQDRVAYKTVESWGKKGLTPAQIASKWNSGSPDKYKTAKPGYNAEQGVKYDVKSYVNNVAKYYDQYNKPQSQQGFNPNPYSNPTGGIKNAPGQFDLTGQTTKNEVVKPSDETLGGQLTNRAGEATQAINSIVGGEKTGSSRVSGVLQLGGALAGGLGDVVNKGLELIPGVKQLENLLGQGVGALAKTPVGQSVMKSVQDFSTSHPELAKDIGAGFNIITAIPILKGLGVVGKLGMEAGSQALKGVAEKSFTTGASDLISSTKTGARFLSQRPEVVKNMLDRRLIGDIKGGAYTTGNAVDTSWKTITDSNNKIKSILKETNKNKFTIGNEDANTILNDTLNQFPESKFTGNTILSNGKKLTPQNGKLWDKFITGDATLEDINKLRSDLDVAVKSVYTSVSQPPIRKELGKSLADSMRSFVKAQAPETVSLFDEMTTQFNIQKALGYMEGKSVQPGGMAKFAGHAVGIGAGGTVGGLIGGPTGAVIGGLVGEKAAGSVASKLAGKNITQGILKRTGNNATRISKNEMLKKLPGLFGGAVNVK